MLVLLVVVGWSHLFWQNRQNAVKNKVVWSVIWFCFEKVIPLNLRNSRQNFNYVTDVYFFADIFFCNNWFVRVHNFYCVLNWLAILAGFFSIFLFYEFYHLLEKRITFHDFFEQKFLTDIDYRIDRNYEIAAIIAKNLHKFYDSRKKHRIEHRLLFC